MSQKRKFTIDEHETVHSFILEKLENVTGVSVAEKLGVIPKYISTFKNNEVGSDLSPKMINLIIEKVKTNYKEEYYSFINPDSTEAFDNYIYYYLSQSGFVKTAIMSIPVSNLEWSKKKGELIYYKKDNYGIEEIKFDLNESQTQLFSSNTNPKTKFFSAVYPVNGQVNFFTININGKPLKKRKILFLTYSVVEEDLSLSCGYGMLIKENTKENAVEKITNILNNTEVVEDWIICALQKKKMNFSEFETMVYNDQNDFLKRHHQYTAIKDISGLYLGYFLKIKESAKNVVKIILEIKNSGESNIYFTLNDQTKNKYSPRYKGNVSFPGTTASEVKGTYSYFEFQDKNKYYLFLDIDGNELSGVFSRWTKDGVHGIFSSPIFFGKINATDTLDLKSLIDLHDLGIITKDRLTEDNLLIEKFNALSDKYFGDLKSFL